MNTIGGSLINAGTGVVNSAHKPTGIFCAHDGYSGAYVTDFSSDAMVCRLSPIKGGGSMIFTDWSYFVPDLEVIALKLEPNAAGTVRLKTALRVEGATGDPPVVAIGSPFRVIDTYGRRRVLTVLKITAKLALVNYE